MKAAHMNSLVLRADELNAVWLKLDVLGRQMALAKEANEGDRVRLAMANVETARLELQDLIQNEKAAAGGVA